MNSLEPWIYHVFLLVPDVKEFTKSSDQIGTPNEQLIIKGIAILEGIDSCLPRVLGQAEENNTNIWRQMW